MTICKCTPKAMDEIATRLAKAAKTVEVLAKLVEARPDDARVTQGYSDALLQLATLCGSPLVGDVNAAADAALGAVAFWHGLLHRDFDRHVDAFCAYVPRLTAAYSSPPVASAAASSAAEPPAIQLVDPEYVRQKCTPAERRELAFVDAMALFVVSLTGFDITDHCVAAVDVLKARLDREADAETPNRSKSNPALALALMELGIHQSYAGHDETGSLESLEEAAAIFKRLVRREPTVFGQRYVLLLQKISMAHSELENWQGAVDSSREAVAQARQLFSASGSVVDRILLSRCLEMHGNSFVAQPEDDKNLKMAVAILQEAVSMSRPLVEANATKLVYVNRLVSSMTALSHVLEALEQLDSAHDLLFQALDVFKIAAPFNNTLVVERDNEDALTSVHLLADVHDSIASLHYVRGSYQDARYHAQQAVNIWRGLVNEGREDEMEDLANAYDHLREANLALHRYDEAVDAAKQAVDIFKHLASEDPSFDDDLAELKDNLTEAMTARRDANRKGGSSSSNNTSIPGGSSSSSRKKRRNKQFAATPALPGIGSSSGGSGSSAAKGSRTIVDIIDQCRNASDSGDHDQAIARAEEALRTLDSAVPTGASTDDDVLQRRQRAQCLLLLGQERFLRDSTKSALAAIKSLNAAIELYRGLVQGSHHRRASAAGSAPVQLQDGGGLAHSLYWIGCVHLELGQPEDIETAHREISEAVDLYTDLMQQHGYGEHMVLRQLGCLMKQAVLCSKFGDKQGAGEAAAAASEIYLGLLQRDFPKHVDDVCAYFSAIMATYAPALSAELKASQTLVPAFVAKRPRLEQQEWQFVETMSKFCSTFDKETALVNAEYVVDVLQHVCKTFNRPENGSLELALRQLSIRQTNVGDLDEAHRTHLQALSILRRLVKHSESSQQQQQQQPFRADLVRLLNCVSVEFMVRDNLKMAHDVIRESLAHARQLHQGDENNGDNTQLVAKTLAFYGTVLDSFQDSDHWRMSVPLLQEAVKLRRKLLQDNNGDVYELIGSLYQLSNVYISLSLLEQAYNMLHDAIKLVPAALSTDATAAAVDRANVKLVANVHDCLSIVYLSEQEARDHALEAIRLFKLLVDAGAANDNTDDGGNGGGGDDQVEHLSRAYDHLRDICMDTGSFDEAIEASTRAAELFERLAKEDPFFEPELEDQRTMLSDAHAAKEGRHWQQGTKKKSKKQRQLDQQKQQQQQLQQQQKQKQQQQKAIADENRLTLADLDRISTLVKQASEDLHARPQLVTTASALCDRLTALSRDTGRFRDLVISVDDREHCNLCYSLLDLADYVPDLPSRRILLLIRSLITVRPNILYTSELLSLVDRRL